MNLKNNLLLILTLVVVFVIFIIIKNKKFTSKKEALQEKEGYTMTVEEMKKLVQKHADLENKHDVKGVLATLVENPVYEVEIQNDYTETDVIIDATTGDILSVQEEEIEDEEEDEGPDVPITGSALDRASAVALDHIGEGRVTDTEMGDEEGFYEIEVTLSKGDEVDVHLDEDFNVLSVEW